MNLNQINLSAQAVASIYCSSLIDSREHIVSCQKNEASTEKFVVTSSWKWLGENKKNILIGVSYEDAVHMPDNELQLLTNMLIACQLSLADVAIVNIKNQPYQNYKEVIDHFKSKICLLFDMEPASFGLPLSFPHFQIQPFANCTFLYAPSLKELEEDKVQKSKLWVALRRLFGI